MGKPTPLTQAVLDPQATPRPTETPALKALR